MNPDIKNLILELYAIKAVQFDSFTLKGDIPSPVYIDARLIISYPQLMKKFRKALIELISPIAFDLICGIPYAALPITTAVSIEGNYPMILCRKTAKDYGSKKLIEGKYTQDQTCLLIEDVVTFGSSIIETAGILRSQGLHVQDAIVIIDREQGGKEQLKKNNIRLHPLISIFDLLKVLLEEKKISEETFKKVSEYCHQTQAK